MIAISLACLLLPHASFAKDRLSDKMQSAKTIYLVDQSGNDEVIKAATKQFTGWGRFIITQSKEEADLIVVFREISSMNQWGNTGKTIMEVFPKGEKMPAFTTTSALHLFYDSQHRTKACIIQFREQLEAKN